MVGPLPLFSLSLSFSLFHSLTPSLPSPPLSLSLTIVIFLAHCVTCPLPLAAHHGDAPVPAVTVPLEQADEALDDEFAALTFEQVLAQEKEIGAFL